ncbi:MAG TPA: GWxTD domain-containing protein, partial [Candidatus Acidoferrales bacterium]|nr:GWxTD domain-containing protein [Candidatus Acidoferrales bacterium]
MDRGAMAGEELWPRPRWRYSVTLPALALILASVFSPGATAADKNKLPERYREWLEKDVAYIISKEEKDAFLQLARGEDRDKFIEEFWEIRNPNPGSPLNEFKEEHYRRIQYADTYFKNEWVTEGWRSDRGRIYIILGPPGSRQFFLSGGQVYPIELWFYTTSEPSLPPFFYVMFYQKDGMGDFRLYSPRIDGPDKLVRAAGVENTPRNAWRFLHDFNAELAKASLTLIPSEPADINSPISLGSDAMLMKVLNIANDRFHKEKLRLQRALRESVSVRVKPDLAALKVVALPLRDPLGDEFIHYSLQIDEPQNYAFGSFKGQYFLNLEVQVRLRDAKKHSIYEISRQAIIYYSEKELAEARTRPLSFEDRVPVVPGSYEMEFLLFNRVNRMYYRAAASVEVVPKSPPTMAVGRPVLVQHCDRASSNDEPFVVGGGTHCSLQAQNDVPPSADASLSLLFPVYLDPAAQGATDQPFKVQYTVGKLDRTVKSQVTEDTLDRSRFDRFGTLMVGKSIPLKDLFPGAYMLAIQVTDPTTGHSGGTTFPFRITGNRLPLPNLLTSANVFTDESNGNNDYYRGLCAIAENQPDQAIPLLQHAIERNPQNDRARAQLAKLSYARGDYAQVVSLLSKEGITKSIDREVAQDFIASLEKTGQLGQAIRAAEQATTLLEPTPQIYEQLASLYEKAGESARAEQA